MSNKTRVALEREYEHVKAQLSRPGLDSSWVEMLTKKVKELERKLNLVVPGSKSLPPLSPPRPDPRPDGAQVNAAMRRVVAGLAAAAQAGSNRLPSDLLEALEQEKASYRGLKLREAADVRIESPSLLSLEPSPSADDSWNGGTLFGFTNEALGFKGEIVHVDPQTGRIFASTEGPTALGELALRQNSWCYKPFDFSEAILSAASSPISAHSLERALRSVQGQFDTKNTPCPSLAGLWQSDWGILWGPPGTGKTHSTTLQLVSAICNFPNQRIVAAAPTNRAVDELTRRVAHGLKARGELMHHGVCRIFRGGKGAGEQLASQYPETLQDAEYRRMVAEIDRREQAIAQLSASDASPASIAQERKIVADLRKALPDETLFAARQGRATLIVVTIHRALKLVSELAGAGRFSRVVIDEAGMVSRAAAALISPLAPRVFLAGDPKQIGPISRAPEAFGGSINKWFRCSPMTHLQDARRDVTRGDVLLLTEQHRMHPEICSVVSDFSYSKLLTTAEPARQRASTSRVPSLPAKRSCWIVLDRCIPDPRKLAFRRAQIGRGYERDSSAEMLIDIAAQALAKDCSVLALTPYRAQANRLRILGAERNLPAGKFIASTIHRQQGTEADVVLIDTVAGGRPFAPGELSMILNVAASRARDHLFLLCSTEEASGPITGQLASLLHPVSYRNGRFQDERVSLAAPGEVEQGLSLAAELHSRKQERPLFSDDQVALFQRRVDDGHHLVRGVAGSGKTFVLAHWLARFLEKHPKSEVLVSYFNKALRPLLESLVARALEERTRKAAPSELGRVSFIHVDAFRRQPRLFDAVFVDEAQDMDASQIRALYEAARPTVLPGPKAGLRPLYLFLDDSQNIRANASLDKAELPTGLSFSGRTRVLREAFRSTREILDLAFNCVLDPYQRHESKEPGMREFMKTNDLFEHDLLAAPAQALDGLFHVSYTERSGLPPIVRSIRSEREEHEWLISEIRRLIGQEGIAPREILVVRLTKPNKIATALNNAGIPASAFGGAGGQDAGAFPVGHFDFVRVTTISSCKGHEAPIVFFTGVDQLDDAAWLLQGNLESGDRTPRGLERRLRAFFYVGATRAMYRQYISGMASSRFVQAAAYYSERLRSGTVAERAAVSS